MGIELKGLEKVLKKLDNLSAIKGIEIIEEVAENTSNAIKNKAKKISDTSYLYVGKVKVRDYGTTCFIDIGLSSETTPFELWKPLWFQHWGFKDYGLNFTGQYYITKHQNWFTDAVNSYEKQAIKAVKEKTRTKIREAWK